VEDACDTWLDNSNNMLSNINIYQIYYDVCKSSAVGQQLIRTLQNSPSRNLFSFLKQKVGDQYPDPDPCIENHLTAYLNQPAVKAAIHAPASTTWAGCSNTVNYNYNDVLTSVLPVYENLLTSSKLRMLVYSGDVDGIVPITGTRNWINSLNLNITEAWRAWTDRNGQTGGYTVGYGAPGGSQAQFRFASVRDAGHQVPYTQSQRSSDLLSRFLSNQPI